MADKDTVSKEYMQDSAVFADAFNFYLYDGEQVIKPEQLRPLDTTMIAMPYGTDGSPSAIQKYRDILKSVTAMQDETSVYLLLGIENQSQIHYAMPVRNMLYDAQQYTMQVSEIKHAHDQNKDRAETKSEYLSGFHRTDKILPVITLTVYFGAEEWNAPKDLHSMMQIDEKLKKFVDNYHLHLIDPSAIADEDFNKFVTELHPVLKFIKYSKDMKKLSQAVQEDETFRHISKRTVDMINIMTGTEMRYDQGEECIDMCKAIKDMRELERAEGKAEGRAEGKAEGKEEGALETLIRLVKKGRLTLEEASEEAGLSPEAFKEKAESLLSGEKTS